MSYVCQNDRYCPNATEFESVEEFQEECLACFGARADLQRDGDRWVDETGRVVLQPVAESTVPLADMRKRWEIY